MRTGLALVLLLAVTTSGCLGGEARSEWAFEITGLKAAYSDGARGAGVTVAVLDTGVNVKHPSLDHLVDGKNSNGELIAFKDYIDGGATVADAKDDTGHGTHVIGIMSARGSSFGDKLVNGGVDLLGASPAVQLVVARVCDSDGCDAEALDDAIRWAIGRNADVISLSLGGIELSLLQGLQDRDSQRIQDNIRDAVNDAIDRGIVVVAAAGNEQDDGATDVSFPSSIEGVIAVGAINKNGNVAGFSNHGDSGANQCSGSGILATGRCHPHKKPELVAPGVGILSGWTGDAYVRADGTSQATPFVTSVVAMMLESHGDLSTRAQVDALKRALMDTAAPVSGQETPHDDAAGYGIVQADAAIAAFG